MAEPPSTSLTDNKSPRPEESVTVVWRIRFAQQPRGDRPTKCPPPRRAAMALLSAPLCADMQSSGIALSLYQTFQVDEITLAIPLCALKKDRLDYLEETAEFYPSRECKLSSVLRAFKGVGNLRLSDKHGGGLST
jgi:hypothetical protein